MLIALAVVAQQRPIDRGRDLIGIDLRCCRFALVACGAGRDEGCRGLERRERAACIAGGEPDERRASLGLQHGPPGEAARVARPRDR